MKKTAAVFIALAICITLICPAFAFSPVEANVNAKCAVLYSIDAEKFVYEKNPKTEASVASLAKMTTAMVAIEKSPDLDKKVEITSEMLSQVPESSSVAGLEAGEVYTIRQLLYCLLLPSGNDAAVALAYAVSGSVDAFCTEMNQFVTKTGAEATGFVNPHGYDELGQYSCAADLALIAAYCIKNPVFLEVFSTSEYQITIEQGSWTLYHTNEMMDKESPEYYPYLVGSKTGHTEAAGPCLVSYGKKDGLGYISVVLNSTYEENGETKSSTYKDTRTLLDAAFSSYSVCKVNTPGEIISTLPVTDMKGADFVNLTVEEQLTVIYNNGANPDNFTHKVNIVGEFIAPLEKGTVVGTVDYYDEDGVLVGTSDVLTMEEAEYSRTKALFRSLTIVTWWQYLLIFIISIVVAFILVLLFQYIRNLVRRSRKKREREKRRRMRQQGK